MISKIVKCSCLVVGILLLMYMFFYNVILSSNNVYTYGNEKNVYEIVGIDKDIAIKDENGNNETLDENIKYKKAIVKSWGSTIRTERKFYDENNNCIITIIDMGNRDLCQINGEMYQKIKIGD